MDLVIRCPQLPAAAVDAFEVGCPASRVQRQAMRALNDAGLDGY